jgi:hypothetical protein
MSPASYRAAPPRVAVSSLAQCGPRGKSALRPDSPVTSAAAPNGPSPPKSKSSQPNPPTKRPGPSAARWRARAGVRTKDRTQPEALGDADTVGDGLGTGVPAATAAARASFHSFMAASSSLSACPYASKSPDC